MRFAAPFPPALSALPAPAVRRPLRAAVPLLIACALSACSSMYYSTLETFGVQKREILSDRVADGRDEQQAAKEQFQSTLAVLRQVTGWDPGELGKAYDTLSGELADCERRATAVRDRIDSIEDVAEALFDEWADEARQFSDATLRSRSEAMLRDTRDRYAQLIGAMRKAEVGMEPVLGAFRDQVLFLKHNLNAQAIASLQSNVTAIEADIVALVRDMEASIAAADTFIESLG